MKPEPPRNPSPARKPWHKPEIRKIAAGAAEVGTRATPDGSFSTS